MTYTSKMTKTVTTTTAHFKNRMDTRFENTRVLCLGLQWFVKLQCMWLCNVEQKLFISLFTLHVAFVDQLIDGLLDQPDTRCKSCSTLIDCLLN
eukprot:m.117243 g.117243  ORF g.117243 m.117243 type:complete len:94 (+) comp13625_c0_seq5:2703-2984(+)